MASSLNPLSNIQIGSMSTWASIIIVVILVVVFLAIISAGVFIWYTRKQYYIKIVCFRLVGNTPTRVAIYSAREVAFGMAGDKLWRVAPSGWLKFKVIKWLPTGKKQSAPNEYWYWVRKDGEWINFSMADLDEISKEMGVKFVQEDMRLQRLATDRLLEQRHMKKGFWEQWGNTIMTLIFFLIIAISVAIVFFQLSKVLDKLAPLVEMINQGLKIYSDKCISNMSSSGFYRVS